MQVVLGSSTYDVSYRAVVIGRLDATAGEEPGHGEFCQQAKLLVTLGADALAIDAADTRGAGESVGAGIAGRVDALRSCAGVPLVVASSQIEASLEAARAGASVLLHPDAVAGARSGGVPADAVLLDAGEAIDAGAAGSNPYPVVVSTSDAATHAVAIVNGFRLLRTRDVRGARRVADVLAAILDAAILDAAILDPAGPPAAGPPHR